MPLTLRILLYEAWHEWFYVQWQRGEGVWPRGYTIECHVIFGDYDGFGGMP